MPELGFLLSLPTESVAVRAVVASVLGLGLAALLLRGLKVAGLRFAAVTVPVAALVVAVALSAREMLLPTVMLTTDADGALKFLVRNGYVGFAPVGLPLGALWAGLAGVRLARRLLATRRMRLLADVGEAVDDPRLVATVEGIAARMRVAPPVVAVIDGCPGGAVVVGVHRPTLVVDREVLDSLDDEEVEGLVAHELAHVRRRDNLVALLVGAVRDTFFFVPGGRWVIRRLCSERELAADDAAAKATGRPGALASGLLKVVEHHRRIDGVCAAFSPAPVVARVERLADGTVTPGRRRTAAEAATVVGALLAAVAGALLVPASLQQQATEDGWGRDALAVMLAWRSGEPAATAPPATAFAVYARSTPYAPPAPGATIGVVGDGREFSRGYLRGDRSFDPPSETPVHTRGRLRPLVDDERRWRSTPVVRTGDGIGVYWLHRTEVMR